MSEKNAYPKVMLDAAAGDPYARLAPEVFGQPSPYSGTPHQIEQTAAAHEARKHLPGEPAVLKYFACSHLPPQLRAVAQPFADMAIVLIACTPAGAEQSAGLRKLLEAKDCFVRAALP